MFRYALALRNASQQAINTVPRRHLKNRVPELQKLFQEDNGLPVYLKGGVKDVVLYRITMLLSILGSGYVIYEFYKAAMPKNKK